MITLFVKYGNCMIRLYTYPKMIGGIKNRAYFFLIFCRRLYMSKTTQNATQKEDFRNVIHNRFTVAYRKLQTVIYFVDVENCF